MRRIARVPWGVIVAAAIMIVRSAGAQAPQTNCGSRTANSVRVRCGRARSRKVYT
jgi:hypothetical protein